MHFHEFDTVALKVDMPSHGLKTGDVGAVVQVHSEDAVEVEFVTASGRTQALVMLETGLDAPGGFEGYSRGTPTRRRLNPATPARERRSKFRGDAAARIPGIASVSGACPD